MYDPTACLGVELTDQRPELVAPTESVIARYCDRCLSGFGGGTDGRTGIPMREAMGLLAMWPEWQTAVSDLRPIFARLSEDLAEILKEIPEEWLPSPRKRFATSVLRRRVTLLG